MMYLGNQAVGLNSFISKNIPIKWDIVEYTPTSSSGWQTAYHSLGVTPDIFMVVPDTFDKSITGQSNPIMIFGTNGVDSSGKQRAVFNYLNASNNWDYTANILNIYCEKDNEKVRFYTGSNLLLSTEKKYYFIIIAFNGGDT